MPGYDKFLYNFFNHAFLLSVGLIKSYGAEDRAGELRYAREYASMKCLLAGRGIGRTPFPGIRRGNGLAPPIQPLAHADV